MAQKKKKKKTKPGENKVKIKQVFDYTDMPHEFCGKETMLIVAGRYEDIRDDSYHRWYPDRVIDKKIGEYEHFKTEEDWKAGQALQHWLLNHGMEIKDEFCFNVLIHISW